METKKLNNAQITSGKNYRVLHSIEQVEGMIWKGKAVPVAMDPAHPMRQKMQVACERDWVFFHRDYDMEKNDWDRLYHEHKIDDESIFGLPVILIPIEKLLFTYEPPTQGILRAGPGAIASMRSGQ
jgi:hypothetical protein